MPDHIPHTNFGVVDRDLAISESGHAFLLKLLDGTHPAPPFAIVTDSRLVLAGML